MTVAGTWSGFNCTGPSVNGADTDGAILYITTNTTGGVAYQSNTGAGACVTAEANP